MSRSVTHCGCMVQTLRSVVDTRPYFKTVVATGLIAQPPFETKHVAKNSTHNCLTERYHPRISTSSFDSCHLLILNSGGRLYCKLLTEKGVNPQTKLSCYWHKNYDTVLFFGHETSFVIPSLMFKMKFTCPEFLQPPMCVRSPASQ